MKCNVCGTADNKDMRGPVKLRSDDEGLCWCCAWWALTGEVMV